MEEKTTVTFKCMKCKHKFKIIMVKPPNVDFDKLECPECKHNVIFMKQLS